MQTLSSGSIGEESRLRNLRGGALVRTPSAAMFVSMPEYQFFIPPEIAPPDATYWRTLGISTCAAWFVVTLRSREPEALPDTFLLAWDTDVVSAVTSLDADLESLLFVAPHVRGRKRGWFSRQIKEMWHAADPAEPENPAVVFVGEDGLDYTGLFMDRARGFILDRLVARVGLTANAHKSTTAS
jgi:hypothetical protein